MWYLERAAGTVGRLGAILVFAPPRAEPPMVVDVTYGGTAYGAFFFGGGQLRAVAERLATADADELKRVATAAAEIALERNRERGTTLLAELGVHPASGWRDQVDDINAAMELLRNLVLVITLILGGGTWTASQVQELLEQNSPQEFKQLPRSEDQQPQLNDPSEDTE